jgi:hypothetical protein
MTVLHLLLTALIQQPTTIPIGVADTSPFRRLALPTPNEYRTGSGMPGPRYWQQRVNYTITATLDTATHTVSGRETIRYTKSLAR